MLNRKLYSISFSLFPFSHLSILSLSLYLLLFLTLSLLSTLSLYIYSPLLSLFLYYFSFSLSTHFCPFCLYPSLSLYPYFLSLPPLLILSLSLSISYSHSLSLPMSSSNISLSSFHFPLSPSFYPFSLTILSSPVYTHSLHLLLTILEFQSSLSTILLDSLFLFSYFLYNVAVNQYLVPLFRCPFCNHIHVI